MPSETIWSSNHGSPIQNNSPLSSNLYMSVLDSVDPETAKMLDPMAEGRRLSFNEYDNNLFGFKKGALSAITAPVGQGTPVNYNANGTQRLNFGTASISGGIASRHPPQQDAFLQKFSTVADATREIELGHGLSKISLENHSRRTSFKDNSRRTSFANNDSGIRISPHGSINDNLNMPAPRPSRNQSISDKIDSYNNNSPIQNNAALLVNSDMNNNNNNINNNNNNKSNNQNVQNGSNQYDKNFWNAANASSFTPSYYGGGGGYFIDQNNGQIPHPYGYGRNTQLSPPPFMVPQGPPQFMDPALYNLMSYNPSSHEIIDKNDEKSDNSSEEQTKNHNHQPGGVGLMNRQFPQLMFQNFHPYPMYSSPPPMIIPATLSPPPLEQPIPPQFNSKHSGERENNNASNNPPTSGNSKRKQNSRNGNSNNGKGANHIYRSPLLEEIRSNTKSKEYYMKHIYGHAVEFTKDQHGSRFIQQKLPEASDEEKEVIFNEIRDISYELMTDVFGNYVIQKYFEHGTATQQNILLENMLGHIYDLSLHMYGCRVVQRALEAIPIEGQVKIIEELKDHILVCAKDQNGNHVIQKSIEKIPFDRITFVLESLGNQVYHLSTHPYGCRVIQRLLEFSNIEDQQKILEELNRFIFYLIQDQYGNYVMQHILERGEPKDREEILVVVLGSVVNFSKHKFASNVIEKCIKHGTHQQRKRILDKVMTGNESFEVETVGDDSPLALMMKDQYANYVIQKLVEVFDARSEEKKLLVTKLKQYLKQISSKNTYGKHLASVEKMIVVAETALIEADNN